MKVTRPRQFKSDIEFVEVVEMKTCHIEGIFINKEILGVNDRRFSRILEIRGSYLYGERYPPQHVVSLILERLAKKNKANLVEVSSNSDEERTPTLVEVEYVAASKSFFFFCGKLQRVVLLVSNVCLAVACMSPIL